MCTWEFDKRLKYTTALSSMTKKTTPKLHPPTEYFNYTIKDLMRKKTSSLGPQCMCYLQHSVDYYTVTWQFAVCIPPSYFLVKDRHCQS